MIRLTEQNEVQRILISLGRLEENFKHMSKKIDELSKVSDVALQAVQSAKSAHGRIDDAKADFNEKLTEFRKDYEEKIHYQKEKHDRLDSNITWLWRAVGGELISFIFSILFYFINK